MTWAWVLIRRRLRHPAMTWAWVLILAVAAVSGVIYARDVTGTVIADWGNVSSSLREGVTFIGPLVGVIALLHGRSIYGRDSLLVGPTSARSPAQMMTGIFCVLGFSAVVGYLAGYSIAFVDAAERATAGSPDLLVLAGGLASLLLFVAAGMTLASLPGPRFGPVVGLVVMMALAGGGAGGRFLSLLPTWGGSFVSAGYVENPLLGWFRITWLVAVIAVLLVVTGNRISNGGTADFSRSLRGAAPMLLLLPFIWLGVSRPVELLLPEDNPPVACSETLGTEVCVHRARVLLLEDLTTMVNRYASVFGGVGTFGIDSVYDYLIVPYPDQEPGVLPVQLPYDVENWHEQTATELGTSMVRRRCVSDMTSQEALVRSEVNFGIGLWWYHQAGFGMSDWVQVPQLGPNPDAGEVADLAAASGDNASWAFWRLEALGVGPAKDWVLDHVDAIQTCSLTPEDLP